MVIHSRPKGILVATLPVATYEPFKSSMHGIGSIIVSTRTFLKG